MTAGVTAPGYNGTAPPLDERFVRPLRFTFIFVKTSACLAAEHLAVAQPKQNRGYVIAPPVRLFQSVANINGNIDADFIDQSQWTHGHAPLHKRIVYRGRIRATFE